MGIGILAPVPATLIMSAVETCDREGVVAFGTNAVTFFEGLDKALPVLIQPTVHDGDPDRLGRSTFAATYDRFEAANGRGHLESAALRPAKVFEKGKSDSPWRGFWLVRDLHKLPDRIPSERLTALHRNTPLPRGFAPRGPLIVKAEFLSG